MVTKRWCADLASLETIRDFVAEVSRSFAVDDRVVRDLQLAVDEICANSIRHGYGGQEGQIEVAIRRTERAIEVVVRDWGKAFDPDQIAVPDLALPLEERSLGGLGLFLVRQVMDEVCFEFNDSKGNSVTMLKRLDGQENA